MTIPNTISMQVRYSGDDIELDTFSHDNIHIDDIFYTRTSFVNNIINEHIKTYINKIQNENGSPQSKNEMRFAIEALNSVFLEIQKANRTPNKP